MPRKGSHLAALLALAFVAPVHAQPAARGPASPDGVWESVVPATLRTAPVKPWLRSGKFRSFQLNPGALRRVLDRAPREFSEEARRTRTEVTLPMADGTFARFRVVESPVMEPELAAKFPGIKTYSGQGIDDPTATVRFDTSASGLRGVILSAGGSAFIDPLSTTDPEIHASVRHEDLLVEAGGFRCGTEPGDTVVPFAHLAEPLFTLSAASPRVELRTYRLALAAQGEYTRFHGGTVAGALAAMVTTVNRLNSVYERELAIRFVLIANNDRIIYPDPLTDPYSTNNNDQAVLDQNQINLDTVIGSTNYDVGHVLNRGFGGRGNFGVCNPSAKAKGATGLPYPAGPSFDIDYLGHELGHQFTANHSWNGTNGFCALDQYNASSAYEPGSGCTIMSYTANCTSDDIEPIGLPYFHSGSYAEIMAYVTSGVGGNCPARTVTGNTAPIVNAGPSYTIPKLTPFTLTATGSDPDGDTVTYSWEERDLGPRQPLTGPGSADNGTSPLFRWFLPTTNASRTFPNLEALRRNQPSHGEQLPSTQRALRFRVTARDNRAGGGGVRFADTVLNVVTNAGPFVVTAPNSAVIWTGRRSVTWDVAGTTNAQVRTTNVNIRLSLDGGFTYPIVLASNTPNDGEEQVDLPEVQTAQARIKVEAVGNVFFDISDVDFTITGPIAMVDATLEAEECAPPNGAADPGETVTIALRVRNVAAITRTNVVVELVAGNGVWAPSAAQIVEALSPGASSTNAFRFTVDSSWPCGGTLEAIVHLRDITGDLGSVPFHLPVGRTELTAYSAANMTAIRPFYWSTDSPYPSAVLVTNVPETIHKVTVTLSNLTRFVPDLVDVLLVSPSGQSVLLISDLPFGYSFQTMPVTTLTFDDEAPAGLGDVFPIVSGSYRPSDFDYFPGALLPPAPAGPHAPGFSALAGSNPNGTWRLFAAEHFTTQTNQSSIAGGWSLTIFTSNTVCCADNPSLALTMEDSVDPIAVGQPLTYTLTVSNRSRFSAIGVTLTDMLPAGVSGISSVASQGACAIADGVLTCDLGGLRPGANARVDVQVTPNATGTLTNRAVVTGSMGNGGVSDDSATVLTTVDAAPALLVDDVTLIEGDAGNTNAIFRVLLSSVIQLPVTVRFATSNGTATAGSDYVATNGSLTFEPGEISKVIAVPVIGDTTLETDETFFVVLTDAANAAYDRSIATATIRNDEASISVRDATPVAEGNIGTRSATFAITIFPPKLQTITVSYVTSNGTATAGADYAAQSGRLTFAPGSPGTNLAVLIGGDTQIEGDETFFLTLFNPTNATIGPQSQATGVILDDDGRPGQLDHFTWSGLASTQYAGLVFPATLTALDAANNPAAAFRGPASIRALGPSEDTVVGTAAANAWTFPMQSGSHDARLQSIFLAGELGATGRITALALDVAIMPSLTLSNWTLRLKHTAQTNYPVNAWDGVGWTLVYQTNLSVMTTGWVTFPFSAPFDYNGASNLLVDFSFNNPASGTAGQCRYRSVTGPNRSLFGQANSTFGDPLAWSGINAPGSAPAARIPIVRFTLQPTVPLGPGLADPFVTGSWTGELVALAASSGLMLHADDGDGHVGVSDALTIEPPPDADADGLPDPWELRHFGALDAPDGGPFVDFDHDGASNRDEFLAGTDPIDGASAFQVGIEIGASDVRIRFATAPGKTYRVEHTDSLSAPIGWEPVPGREAIPGRGAVVEVIEPGAATRAQRFYRVRLN